MLPAPNAVTSFSPMKAILPKRRRRPARISGRHRFQPRAEALEARRLLAVFTVDTAGDVPGICVADNPAANVNCSLRSAVEAADANPGADRIEIPADLYELNSSLEVAAPGDLTIIGLGAAPIDVTIDAQTLDRAFDIFGSSTASTIRFENLAILNGNAFDGSGGGAINIADAALEVQSVVFRNNDADFGFGISTTSGGAIVSNGDVTIRDSLFQENTATEDGGAIALFPPLGGGIANVLITETTFNSNTTGDSTIDLGRGGSIFVADDVSAVFDDITVEEGFAGDSGGGIFVDGGTIFLTNSQIAINEARGSDSGGGGVYVLGDGDANQFTITGTTFNGNSANAGAGGFESVNAGGDLIGSTFEFNFVNSTVPSFDEGGGGAAILTFNDAIRQVVNINSVTFRNNTAPSGGGLAIVDTDVDIAASTFVDNNATSSLGGGGIGVVGVNFPRILDIRDSFITDNTTAGEAGGIGAVDANVVVLTTEITGNEASGGRAGGVGILGNATDPTLSLNQVLLFDNSASGDGGGVAVADANFSSVNSTIVANNAGGNGGGLAFGDVDAFVQTIQFSTIADNSATAGSNLAVSGTTVDVTGSIFSGGTAVAVFGGNIDSGGFNLDSGNTLGLSQATDLINTNPQLGMLADNGGLVRTRLPAATSPVIDVVTIGFPAVDARDIARPQGPAADIGAVEQSGAPATGTLTIANRSVNEDAGTVTIDVVLDNAIPGGFTVDAFPENIGEAAAGTDFVDFFQTLTFAGTAGETQSFDITIIDDAIDEPNERFRVELTNGSNANVDITDTALVTIVDDDAPAATGSLSVANQTVAEDGGSVTIDVVLDNAIPGGFTVDATTVDLEATAGADYVATGPTLTFVGTAGEVQSFAVAILDDADVEAVERFRIDLSNVSNVNVDISDRAIVRITDNDFAGGPPIAADRSRTVDEDSSFGINLENLISGGAFDTITVSQGLRGSVVFDAVTGIARYTPNRNAFGDDRFFYRATGPGGDDRGTISITINPINDPPVANDDEFRISNLGPSTIRIARLLSNDRSGPTNEGGGFSFDSIDAVTDSGASVRVVGDSIEITPIVNSGTQTDTLRYRIVDDDAFGDSGTITLNYFGGLFGHVYCDLNGNGREDDGEASAGARVFVDQNGDRAFNGFELSTRTDANGDYRINAAPVGDIDVVAEVPDGCISIPTRPGVVSSVVPLGNLARGLTAWDRDGDGDTDLAVAVENDGTVIHVNNARGTLSVNFTADLGAPVQSIASPPLVPDDAAKSPQRVQWLRERAAVVAVASPGFAGQPGSVFVGNRQFDDFEAGNGPIDVAMADVDNDFRPDVLVTSFRSSTFTVFSPEETFDATTIETGLTESVAIDPADLNGDGNVDIVVAGIGGVQVFVGDGAGGFRPAVMEDAGPDAVDVVLADVNDDGLSDIVSVASDGTVTVFRTLRSGRTRIRESVSSIARATDLAAGDFNRDGLVDLAIASKDASRVMFLGGLGRGRFTPLTSVATRNPTDLVAFDLDGDGDDELAVLNLFNDEPSAPLLPSTLTVLRLDVAEDSIRFNSANNRLDFAFPHLQTGQSMDVNRDGQLSPSDALMVINQVRRQSSAAEGELATSLAAARDADVNGDGRVTVTDALTIINELRRERLALSLATASAQLQADDLEEQPEVGSTLHDEAIGQLF